MIRAQIKRLGRPIVASVAYYSGYCHAIEALGINQGARILGYHGVEARPSNPYAVSTEDFAQQMAWVAEQCTALSMDQLVALLQAGAPLPKRAVAITIDDGLHNTYTQAFPVLERLGLAATVFLPVAFIDGNPPASTTGYLAGTRFMSWDQVREMSRSGITFGSHTVNHFSLARLTRKEVHYELHCSKEQLETATDMAVTGFAYPYGTVRDFNDELGHMVAAAGYSWAVTGISGINDSRSDLFALRRTKVERNDSISLFQKAIDCALDPWVVVDRMGRFL